jgi:hypothetical protein
VTPPPAQDGKIKRSKHGNDTDGEDDDHGVWGEEQDEELSEPERRKEQLEFEAKPDAQFQEFLAKTKHTWQTKAGTTVYQASYQELQKMNEGVLLTDKMVIPTWANRFYTCDVFVTNSGAHAALGFLGLDQTVMVVVPEDEQYQQRFLFTIAMHL